MSYKIIIPFSGLQDTLNLHIIENQIESYFDDDLEEYNKFENDFNNWSNLFTDYSKIYVKELSNILKKISNSSIEPILEFENLKISTDRFVTNDKIFATINKEYIDNLYSEIFTDKNLFKDLKELIKDKCTSYNGFVSYYSNDIKDWLETPINEWTEAQLELLLEAKLISGNLINKNSNDYSKEIYDYITNEVSYKIDDLLSYIDEWKTKKDMKF